MDCYNIVSKTQSVRMLCCQITAAVSSDHGYCVCCQFKFSPMRASLSIARECRLGIMGYQSLDSCRRQFGDTPLLSQGSETLQTAMLSV
jgi:hypothetical protein